MKTSLPLPARAYLWLVTLAAIAFVAYWLHAWRGPLPAGPAGLFLMVLLLGLGILAQHCPLTIEPGHKVDVSIAVYFASLLLLGVPAAMLLVAASQLVGQGTLALRRDPATGRPMRSVRSVLFNTSQFTIAAGLAGLVYYSLLPHRVPAPLDRPENLGAVPAAAAAMYLVNTLSVAVMIGLQRGRNPIEIWRSGQRREALQFAGLFLVGLVTALTSSHYAWAPLVMALPAAVLHLSLQRTVRLLAAEQLARAEAEAAAERIRQLQAAIEQEWAPRAAVLAGMGDGVLVLDAARRVRYCNPRAGQLLGTDPSELVGRDGLELAGHPGLRPIDPRAARWVWGRVITRPRECPSAEITTSDGSARRVLLLSGFPVVDADGERLGLVLRDVTDSKVRAALEERDRIAMDLHDGVIQSLYAVMLGLSVVERSLNGDAAVVQAPLRKQRARIEAIIQEIRNYIFHLRSREFCQGSLAAGLAAIVEELHSESLLRVQLEVEADAEDLDPDGAADILHIAREATSNVIKHARASTVVIRLVRVDGRLILTICDDGGGFDPHGPMCDPCGNGRRSGDGLRNMAERARALGGRLTVRTEPERGTEVRLEVPPPESSEENDGTVREAASSR